MHTFVIAEHPEFGKIRTVEKDGKSMVFASKDVASSWDTPIQGMP